MSKRAHNSTFASELRFQGVTYRGPTDLFERIEPRAVIGLATFLGRLRKLNRDGTLIEERVYESLYLSPRAYMAKYAVRKTWVVVGGKPVDLESYYGFESASAAVPYSTFRSRVRMRPQHVVDEELLEKALTLTEQDWISFYGGGRHRNFAYDGELYPDLKGKSFHGVSAFLKVVGRYSEKSKVWSRLKSGWKLDDALSVPVEIKTERTGLIYKLTRIRTGQIYIGLSLGSLENRWTFHLRAARNGARTKLAVAIRSDGPEGFKREIIEDGIEDPKELKIREIYWANELDALGPEGLNMAKPGGLSTPRGKKIEVNGETFGSIVEASVVLAERTGLAIHAVASRIRSGAPLPVRVRKQSRHPEAGSNLFRRWLALLRRHPEEVESTWLADFDAFKTAVQSTFQEGRELARLDDSRPWGPSNVEWVTVREKIERIHGKSLVVMGRRFGSLRSVADEFGIGLSTLKDRLSRQGLSPNEAVSRQLSVTSYRKSKTTIVVDGKAFRSKRQAILYLSGSRGITENQAKYRLATYCESYPSKV